MSEASNWEDDSVHLVGQPAEETLDLNTIPKEFHKQFMLAAEARARGEMPDDLDEMMKLDMRAAGIDITWRTRLALNVRKVGGVLLRFSHSK